MNTIKHIIIKPLQKAAIHIKALYRGSDIAAFWASNIVICTILALLLDGSGLPKVLDFLVFFLGLLLIVIVVEYMVAICFKPIVKTWITHRVSTMLLFASIVIYISVLCYEKVWMSVILLASLVVTLAILVLVRSSYVILRFRRTHWVVSSMLVISLVCNLGIVYFLFSDAPRDSYRNQFLQLKQPEMNETNLFTQAGVMGTYSVGQLSYGDFSTETSSDTESLSSEFFYTDFSNKEFPYEEKIQKKVNSRTVDLEPYVGGYDGITKVLRTKYFGFDIHHVPLSGEVWYPIERLDCPVLFIVHGNHTLTEESYLGYEYIGRHLASRGYVVVSVNENVLNHYIDQGIFGENDARAILLLENMQLVREWNEKEGNPLYQRMDYEKVSIAGHSRGGEAVAIAALFNQIKRFPDNGNIRFDYGFHIKSIIAIAPTTDQYRPATKDLELEDVNYLLIQGSNDQDVNSFMGTKQYENVHYTGRTDCFKSYLYIDGANHGQFNTRWNHDFTAPLTCLINESNLLTGEEQRQILLGFMTSFLDVTVGEENDRSLFTNYELYRTQMPETIFVQRYEDSTFNILADYEEDIDLTTITIPSGVASATNMNYWREEKEQYAEGDKDSDRDNYVLNLNWTSLDAKYEMNLSTVNKTRYYQVTDKSYLQFDVKNNEIQKVKEGEYQLLNFEVVVTDSDGNEAKITVADYATIYPAIPVRLYKLQFYKDLLDYKSEFQTVRIPIEAFSKQNKQFDYEKIEVITFQFNQQPGNILLDNIGFSD